MKDDFDELFSYAIQHDTPEKLNKYELDELWRLYSSWDRATKMKQWKRADRLRLRLERYGCESSDKYTTWHPLWESRTHYWNRIARRIKTNC